MNKRFTSIFTVVLNNEIICFDTNLKGLHHKFKLIEDRSGNYQWFYRKFLKEDRFSLMLSEKEYWLQKLS